MRITTFENSRMMGGITNNTSVAVNGMSLYLYRQYMPGSFSLSSVYFQAYIRRATSTQTLSAIVLLGLYSLTGTTLTLLNSASFSTSLASGTTNSYYTWFAMAVATNIDLAPGQYYFAHLSNSAGVNYFDVIQVSNIGNTVNNNLIAGLAPMLSSTATTDAFPASIASNGLNPAFANTICRFPYLLLSA